MEKLIPRDLKIVLYEGKGFATKHNGPLFGVVEAGSNLYQTEPSESHDHPVWGTHFAIHVTEKEYLNNEEIKIKIKEIHPDGKDKTVAKHVLRIQDVPSMKPGRAWVELLPYNGSGIQGTPSICLDVRVVKWEMPSQPSSSSFARLFSSPESKKKKQAALGGSRLTSSNSLASSLPELAGPGDTPIQHDEDSKPHNGTHHPLHLFSTPKSKLAHTKEPTDLRSMSSNGSLHPSDTDHLGTPPRSVPGHRRTQSNTTATTNNNNGNVQGTSSNMNKKLGGSTDSLSRRRGDGNESSTDPRPEDDSPNAGLSRLSTSKLPPSMKPLISGISPSHGPPSGGTIVTIHGSNLGIGIDDIEDILLCGVSCLNTLTYISPTLLKIVTPAGAFKTPSGPLIITTSSGGKGKCDATFSYIPTPSAHSLAMEGDPPEVSGLSPSFGPGEGYTPIKIRGINLGYSREDIEAVMVCGIDCSESIRYVSPQHIECVTRAGCGIGAIVVITRSGGVGGSSVKYRYNPKLRMKDFDEDSEEETSSSNKEDELGKASKAQLLVEISSLRKQNEELKEEKKRMHDYIDRLLLQLFEFDPSPECLERLKMPSTTPATSLSPSTSQSNNNNTNNISSSRPIAPANPSPTLNLKNNNNNALPQKPVGVDTPSSNRGGRVINSVGNVNVGSPQTAKKPSSFF